MLNKTLPDTVVLEAMKPGHYYQNIMIQRLVKLTSVAVSDSLKRLVESGQVHRKKSSNGSGVAYVRLAEEGIQAGPVHARPYRLSREMLAAADRVGELRIHPSKY